MHWGGSIVVGGGAYTSNRISHNGKISNFSQKTTTPEASVKSNLTQ